MNKSLFNIRNPFILIFSVFLCVTQLSCKTQKQSSSPSPLVATHYFSGFENAHDTYNAISTASDGKIYYVLSSASIDTGGQVYVYDPASDKIKFLGDLTDICGEKGKMAVAQGKSHVDFYERKGKLYFATHVGYYEIIDGMERLPVHAPDGYSLYRAATFCRMTWLRVNLRISPRLLTGKGSLRWPWIRKGDIFLALPGLRDTLFIITWRPVSFTIWDSFPQMVRRVFQAATTGFYAVPCLWIRKKVRFISRHRKEIYYPTIRPGHPLKKWKELI